VKFEAEGLDFVMTALFIAIFIEQWLKEKSHISALIGIAVPVGCLVVFGGDGFLAPSLLVVLLALTALKKPIEKADDKA
jgi:4-azaleucine resistance transporter AzlC